MRFPARPAPPGAPAGAGPSARPPGTLPSGEGPGGRRPLRGGPRPARPPAGRILAAALSLVLPSLFLASCAKTAQGLRGDFSVGEFTGTAGPEVARALRQASAVRGADGPIITGSAEYRFDGSPGRETAIVSEAGEERVYWEEDPLTGVAWLVKALVSEQVPRDFEFRRVVGVLEVSWELKSPSSGRIMRSGREVFSASRAAGGYVDSHRPGQPLPPADDGLSAALLEELASAAASDLTLLAGPRIQEGDLAHIPGPEGQRARSMAASGDWEGAEGIWREILSLNPTYDPALYNLGLCSEASGDLPEAWRRFRLAFRARQLPLYREALSRATEILRREGKLPGADM